MLLSPVHSDPEGAAGGGEPGGMATSLEPCAEKMVHWANMLQEGRGVAPMLLRFSLQVSKALAVCMV